MRQLRIVSHRDDALEFWSVGDYESQPTLGADDRHLANPLNPVRNLPG